jgi:hypothetical protein
LYKAVTIKKTIRKAHRVLGVFFGIQFLLWTLGGLYFSWTDIKEIRGEDLRLDEPPLLSDRSNISLSTVINNIKLRDQVQEIRAVQIVTVLDKQCYQVTYNNGAKNRTQLADAATGVVRQPLSEKEAVAVALSRLKAKGAVKKVEYITETGAHHEYREKPLPAYAVSFGGDINTTVYVGAETGTVQSFRNNRWRIFDFLWMMHTMDYAGRDDINNWLLRIFSAAGLIAILSGFVLYAVTMKRKLNKHKKIQL